MQIGYKSAMSGNWKCVLSRL